jgi:glycosyltransferase involved in cell wall biosynthesis
MQLCEEVTDGLAAKGHSLAVLTSEQFDGEEIERSYPVYRQLPIDPDWNSKRSAAWQFFVGRRERERRASDCLRRLLDAFVPDIVFVWHAIGIPKILLRDLEENYPGKVVYYLADYQPELADEYVAYWEGQPVRLPARLLKGLLGRIALSTLKKENKPIRLKYENVICVSDYVRRRLVSEQLIAPNAVVIHNGVDLTIFSGNHHGNSGRLAAGLRCLVAGRIIADKGVHTVIDAFALLAGQVNQRQKISLTIIGSGPEDYVGELRKKVKEDRLEGIIEFRPPVPRIRMPEILAGFDALILSSQYDEPLARSIQEAMAMGLLVIGTITGGSGELLVHGKTGLVFVAGDPRSLAEQLSYALDHPEKVAQLRSAGQKEVESQFDIQKTIAAVEEYLHTLAQPEPVR